MEDKTFQESENDKMKEEKLLHQKDDEQIKTSDKEKESIQKEDKVAEFYEDKVAESYVSSLSELLVNDSEQIANEKQQDQNLKEDKEKDDYTSNIDADVSDKEDDAPEINEYLESYYFKLLANVMKREKQDALLKLTKYIKNDNKIFFKALNSIEKLLKEMKIKLEDNFDTHPLFDTTDYAECVKIAKLNYEDAMLHAKSHLLPYIDNSINAIKNSVSIEIKQSLNSMIQIYQEFVLKSTTAKINKK